VLKVELHSHSADDPIDAIPHTTLELIDRAAALRYDVLAVTLHDRQLDLRPYESYAAERGITLIPGIERTIQGKHVLLLNFRRGAEDVHTFEDVARLKRKEAGLVIAPHPFFPSTSCLRGRLMDRYADLFDAVEYNAMFTGQLNFNAAAERWANDRGKPMVGNGDIHRLRQLGHTFSMVEAEPDPDAICNAILTGRVNVIAQPQSWPAVTTLMAELLVCDLLPAGFWTQSPVPVPATGVGRTPRSGV
jgi:predicted metal-dependent phosphoesterase TrpH